MLSRLIFAIPTISVIGFPAVAQPKPDLQQNRKEGGCLGPTWSVPGNCDPLTGPCHTCGV